MTNGTEKIGGKKFDAFIEVTVCTVNKSCSFVILIDFEFYYNIVIIVFIEK